MLDLGDREELKVALGRQMVLPFINVVDEEKGELVLGKDEFSSGHV